MTTHPPYTPTPLMERINRQISCKHPHALAIANFGEGPLLTCQGCQARVSCLSVDLVQGNRHVELSHLSQAPYLVALAQEHPDQSLTTVIYSAGSSPILEHSIDGGMTGQVFAFGESPDETNRTLVHAIYLPTRSCVFSAIGLRHSLLLESHPELCSHLLLCGGMIHSLFRQAESGDTYDAQRQPSA